MIRLNKYLSEAGVCSRREADRLIESGIVTVDGKTAAPGMKVEDGQVIMYDGKKCQILTKAGVRLFDGEMENDIANIISVFGVNKYLVINANGLEEIRLAN